MMIMQQTNEERPVTIPVLGNDNDPENDPISIEEITRQPTQGTVILLMIRLYIHHQIIVMILNQTIFTDSFEYNIRDGSTASLVSQIQQLLLLQLNV